MSYADPSTNNDDEAVQDLSGNDAPSFTDQPVAEPMADNDLPGKPTGLAATFNAVEQEMTLTWNTPSSNGGSAITGYKVERSTDNNNWETLEEAHSATTYVDTSVEHGKTYYYRVSATNDDDETGLPSEVLTVHDQSPPALVSASVPTTGTSVQLQFTEALDDTVTLADLDGSYTVTASGVDVTGELHHHQRQHRHHHPVHREDHSTGARLSRCPTPTRPQGTTPPPCRTAWGTTSHPSPTTR